MNIDVKLEGMDDFLEAAEVVKQKAEELEQAVQRLNEVKVTLQTQFL